MVTRPLSTRTSALGMLGYIAVAAVMFVALSGCSAVPIVAEMAVDEAVDLMKELGVDR